MALLITLNFTHCVVTFPTVSSHTLGPLKICLFRTFLLCLRASMKGVHACDNNGENYYRRF